MTTSHTINSISPATAGRSFLFIPLVLVCFALAPVVRAVTPAPDGGYPGSNTAEGTNALFSRTTGAWNTALGFQALYHDTSGSSNTATGLNALFSNTTGKQNTADGVFALSSNTSGSFNIATGYQALLNNTVGEKNVATGYQALNTNIDGDENIAIGYQALLSNETGGLNIAIGDQALESNSTGAANIAVGAFALRNNTTGINNTVLGGNSGNAITTASNVIVIGVGFAAENVTNTTWIDNIYETTTESGVTLPVIVSDDGQLGTMSSSRRYKNDIKPMEQASEAILALNPVTFHYKSDTKGTPQFGLIAEEVAQVDPALVARDKNGDIYTVRYDVVNAMLLNEFLKEHKQVQEQQKQIEKLTARLNEQAAQIQKVSAKIELSKSAPRTVSNDQ